MKNYTPGGLTEMRSWEQVKQREREASTIFGYLKNLFPQVKSGAIYKETRSWERPSDHVPIIVDINI